MPIEMAEDLEVVEIPEADIREILEGMKERMYECGAAGDPRVTDETYWGARRA